jgi:hypothetical protein
VITADKAEHVRPFDEAAKKGPRYGANSFYLLHPCLPLPPLSPLSPLDTFLRSGEYRYARGTTGVLKTSVRKFVVTSETVSRVESMET